MAYVVSFRFLTQVRVCVNEYAMSFHDKNFFICELSLIDVYQLFVKCILIICSNELSFCFKKKPTPSSLWESKLCTQEFFISHFFSPVHKYIHNASHRNANNTHTQTFLKVYASWLTSLFIFQQSYYLYTYTENVNTKWKRQISHQEPQYCRISTEIPGVVFCLFALVCMCVCLHDKS